MTVAGSMWIDKLYGACEELTFPDEIASRSKFRRPILFCALTVLNCVVFVSADVPEKFFLSAAIFLLVLMIRRNDGTARAVGCGIRVANGLERARPLVGGDNRRRNFFRAGIPVERCTRRRRREINRGVGIVARLPKTFARRIVRRNKWRARGGADDFAQTKRPQQLLCLRSVFRVRGDICFAVRMIQSIALTCDSTNSTSDALKPYLR